MGSKFGQSICHFAPRPMGCLSSKEGKASSKGAPDAEIELPKKSPCESCFFEHLACCADDWCDSDDVTAAARRSGHAAPAQHDRRQEVRRIFFVCLDLRATAREWTLATRAALGISFRNMNSKANALSSARSPLTRFQVGVDCIFGSYFFGAVWLPRRVARLAPAVLVLLVVCGHPPGPRH